MSYDNYSSADSNRFLSKVYMWMFIGLMLTAISSYGVMSTDFSVIFFYNIGIVFGLLIFELIIVIILSWAIKSLPPSIATLIFIFYSVLSGITLTPIIWNTYTEVSVFVAFFVAAGMFIGMSLVGYFTKKDLSGVGRFLIMALIGLILASLINLLLSFLFPGLVAPLTFLLSIAGVLIFAGLTAYDTQKIKNIAASVDHGDPFTQNLAIVSALNLYLDFINMFLYMLRLFGQRR